MQMTQEINIHRSVGHKHIVGFHGFFEDSSNVYILLELCRRRVRIEDESQSHYVLLSLLTTFPIQLHFLPSCCSSSYLPLSCMVL